MAILAFQKPDKVIMLDSDEKKGTFEYRPLEPGYGVITSYSIHYTKLYESFYGAASTFPLGGTGAEISWHSIIQMAWGDRIGPDGRLVTAQQG